MKRMYVTLFILFAFFVWGATTIAQIKVLPVDAKTEQTEKAFKMREEIHRRIMDKLLRGVGPDDDLFSDMESLMNQTMKEMDQFIPTEVVKVQWSETSSGRTLKIFPEPPEQKLDINIQDRMITIKGQSEMGSFSQSYSVPGDCDEKKVKMGQEKGTIVMFFPYENLKPEPPKKEERKPLLPSQGDVQI